MFKSIKKLAIRKSAQNIGHGVLQAVAALLPYEQALTKVVHLQDEEEANGAIDRILAQVSADPAVASAVKALQFELMGPIPVESVRQDLLLPFLSSRVPEECTGIIIKQAFRDLVDVSQSGRTIEIAGIEGLWDEVKSELGAPEQMYVDARFADL